MGVGGEFNRRGSRLSFTLIYVDICNHVTLQSLTTLWPYHVTQFTYIVYVDTLTFATMLLCQSPTKLRLNLQMIGHPLIFSSK